MIDPTDRDALEDLMTRYVLGELDDDETRDLERLARQRPAIRDEIGRLRRTLGLVPYAVATAPPPDLRSRVLAAAEAQARETTATPGSVTPLTGRARPAAPARPGRVLTVTRVVGSIAAALIVALTWDGQRLRQELALQQDVATTLQQPNVVRQFALHGTGVSLAAGTVVLDLDAKRAAVAIRGLAPLPPGQTYRLWARIGDGAVPCGQFNADTSGAVVSQFTIPVDAYTSPVQALFLNVEPAEQGAHPVGTTVMAST
ncbi:MAG TPA: anti-sigma factor [Candidatus Binatia bacterium]|jgi:anti-sigma-K factor RskA